MLKHSDLAYCRLAEAWLSEVQLFSSRGFFLGILESTSTCREKQSVIINSLFSESFLLSSPERLSDDHVRAEVSSSCWFWWVFAWRKPCCLLHQDPLISSPCWLPPAPPPPDDDDDDRDDSLRSVVPSRENLDQSSPAGIWEARRGRPGNPAHRGPASCGVSAPSCEDSWTSTSDRPTRTWVCYM